MAAGASLRKNEDQTNNTGIRMGMTRIAAGIWLILSLHAAAEVPLGTKTTAHFASVAEGREVLGKEDDFVARMSAFDRAARLKTGRPVSEEEYLAFVRENILEWSDTEKQMVERLLLEVATALSSFPGRLPEKILLVKTTGAEEGHAAYTRANAIVLPARRVRTVPPARLKADICHEIFHILSRANPELREKLYGIIGFAKCEEIEFPAELQHRKITNPDAPRNDHYIQVKVEGKKQFAVPILFSRTDTYNPAEGGEFFNYLQFKLLLVERTGEPGRMAAIRDASGIRLIDVPQASGFIEQIGKNTQYIIHPEEILADNFTALLTAKSDLPSPEIVQTMRTALARE